MDLQHRTEPGIWFHDLPPVATIRGAIVASDTGTTPAHMAMVMAYESAQRGYDTMTISGVGTSQERGDMTLMFCVRQLAS